ncbi:MAG: hypothetical protein REI78_01785 [Pedobacter sp.]|nr:hypothetical protein [Pedobacter sp.]MDQ8051721.1 hypothetical protein [Pedobacter sp.]
MNYEEAEKIVAEHYPLLGTTYRGKTISKLLITPLKEIGIAKLMYNYANDISSESFYADYQEFEIWVIFDLEDWLLTGVIDKMRLTQFLDLQN